MKSIGLTGGIGSGKSTVARQFEAKGYLVYYADDRAKVVMEVDQHLASALRLEFGDAIWKGDGKLDRSALAGVVFNSTEKLKLLNSLVHPAVARDYDQWIAQIPSSYPKSFVFKEAAILFEAGSYKSADAVLTVYAPKTIRLARVQTRDGVEASAVIARMRNQWPDAKKCFLSDFVIYNDGVHALDPQVDRALAFLEAKWR